MSEMPTVVVAMSGGVDSSVAAALLKQQGYHVIGMMLRLWSQPGRESENCCCTPDDMNLARQVAGGLGIPFYVMDVRQPFYEEVVQPFLQSYQQGQTPNPCIRCNQHIRWGRLMKQAQALGADYLATGHYARVRQTPDGAFELARALDERKDQSYVLSVLNQEQLGHSMFPLGELHKDEVRELAKTYGLGVSRKPDSQDLCFLAGEDYRAFLERSTPEVVHPGAIVDRQGNPLGWHRGLAFYTIGQRKGLGLATPRPLYVLEKDLASNTLVVGEESELGSSEMLAAGFNWVSGKLPEQPLRAEVKIRYKATLAPATLEPLDGNRVHVRFDHPLRDITPGQRAVAYSGETVLGGGMIQSIIGR